jgi:hypothetical protein
MIQSIKQSNFGAEIWWTGQKTFTNRLQTQQNAALRRIQNAFRLTPIIPLHKEAALPPVSVRLQSKQRKYVLRLLTLPPSHPVIKHCPSSFPVPNYLSTTLCDTDKYDFDWTQKCRPPSRLGKALCALSPWVHPDADVDDTAQPTTAPWSAPTITVDIQNLPKDAAATAHLSLLHDLRGDPQNVIAYTDGSQLSTQTGAGFYIPHGLPNPIRTVIPLGSTSEVFDAELKAIAECLRTYLKYIKRHRLHDCSIHLFTDNQSAILRAMRLDRGPGQEKRPPPTLGPSDPPLGTWPHRHRRERGGRPLSKVSNLAPPPRQHTHHPLLAQAPNQGATLRRLGRLVQHLAQTKNLRRPTLPPPGQRLHLPPSTTIHGHPGHTHRTRLLPGLPRQPPN